MKQIDFNVKLLELNYQRYISRAHTTFEAGSALAIAIILGVGEAYSRLIEISIIFANKFWLFIFSASGGVIALIVLTIGLIIILDSRKHRNRIEKELKKLRDNKLEAIIKKKRV